MKLGLLNFTNLLNDKQHTTFLIKNLLYNIFYENQDLTNYSGLDSVLVDNSDSTPSLVATALATEL